MIAKSIERRPHFRHMRRPNHSRHIPSRNMHRKFNPLVNIIENDNDYIIEIAIPGMNKEDISMEIKDMNLHISRKSDEDIENKEAKVLLREYDYTEFEKVFSLSKDIDQTSLQAEYSNGILQVTLPKKEKVSKKITIH